MLLFLTSKIPFKISPYSRTVPSLSPTQNSSKNLTYSCFDFDLPLHLLATASYNSYIFLWNYYSPQKPISILRGHLGTVISLKIQPAINHLYSLSNDSVLKAWDIKKETCVQSVNLDFVSIQVK